MYLRARFALLLSLVALTARSAAQDPLRDYIAVRGGYLGLGQPMPIASPGVTHGVWSKDGRYILTVQSISVLPSQDLGSDQSLGLTARLSVRVWDRTTNESRELWSASADQYRIERLEWFTGSDSALALVTESRYDRATRTQVAVSKEVLRFGTYGTPDVLLSLPINQTSPTIEVAVSPTSAMGGILAHVDGTSKEDGTAVPGTTSITELRGNGEVGAIIRLTDSDPPQHLAISEDGGLLIVTSGSSESANAVVNFRTGRLEAPLKPIRAYDDAGERIPYRVELGDGSTNNSKASRRTKSIWISSKEDSPLKTALVAWDATEGSPNPRGDAIFYISEGIAIVRPLVALKNDEFNRVYRASLKTVSMRTAESVSKALLAYAHDHGGKLPKRSDPLATVLNSYLQLGEGLTDFIYLGEGQDLGTISRPARTQLGFVRTKVGRAAVFANGSVEWIDGGTN